MARKLLITGATISAVVAATSVEIAVGPADAGTAKPATGSGAIDAISQAEAVSSGLMAYSHTVNRDGSQTDVYKIPSGPTITSVTPPPGFSPLRATAAQLEQYGFPLRPPAGDALVAWTKAMAAWRSTPTPKMTFTGLNSTPTSSDATSDPLADFFGNGNWSGWHDYASSQKYTGAEADFIAPNVGAACSGTTNPGIWVGLGGVNSKQLMQDGIAAAVFSGPTVWQPFWEILNSSYAWPPIQLKGTNGAISITPDDTMYAKTTYTASSDEAYFFVEDETTGQATSQTFTTNSLTGNPASYYDGSTADFEMEFPTGYAPFQEYAFADAEADDSSGWSPLGDYSHTQDTSLPYVTSGPLGSDKESFAEGFLSCT